MEKLHAEYGPGYFAAFVIDPDGYRMEAVINENAEPSAPPQLFLSLRSD